MKRYLLNSEKGAPIKNWYDGSNHWSLDVGEVKAFPEAAADLLVNVYAFLQEVSVEEYEAQLAKLDKVVPMKVKVGDEGGFVPKNENEIKEEKEELEVKKTNVKKAKKKVEEAKDAEPEKPSLWEMTRGALIALAGKKNVEIKGLGKKGVKVTKEQIINLLEDEK